MRDLFRLAIGGFLLDTQAFRDQRDAAHGVQRGLLLVALIGVLVGFSSVLGNLIEQLATPSSAVVIDTAASGLRAMPWYEDMASLDPTFTTQFDELFTQLRANPLFGGGGVGAELLGIVTTPLLAVINWLIFGTIIFLAARLLGGKGGFAATLSTVALVSSANLLAVVQIVPFAQVAGIWLLSLLIAYVAIRETHNLSPWRTFGAALFGPLVLLLLAALIGCILFFAIGSIAGL